MAPRTDSTNEKNMTDRVNQWFAVMVTGLAAQGWQRSTVHVDGLPNPQCVYKSEEGLMCPVGMILPADSPILVSNEIVSVASLSDKERLIHLGLGPLVGREYFFLVEAQRAHDGDHGGAISKISPDEMKESFRKLADVYHLELPLELKQQEQPA